MKKLGEVVWRLIYRRNENLNKKKGHNDTTRNFD